LGIFDHSEKLRLLQKPAESANHEETRCIVGYDHVTEEYLYLSEENANLAMLMKVAGDI